MHLYQWIESEVPNGLEVRQVYGFIFSADGRILLLEDEGQYNLPGGKPEDNESRDETLTRESLEEGQLIIDSHDYLGYQLIKGIEEFAQVRLLAIIKDVRASALDPSTGRQYRRWLVPPHQVNDLLKWGQSGDHQLATAVAKASVKGVLWNGMPIGYIDDSPLTVRNSTMNSELEIPSLPTRGSIQALTQTTTKKG